MLPFWQSLVLLVALHGVYSVDDGESGARLLVSKQILNKYIVEDMDLVVKYTLYNIGNNAAVNVILNDASFNKDAFSIAGGRLNIKVPRIPPNQNVSHTVVLRPSRIGFYNFTAAEVTYLNADDSPKMYMSVSSEPGEGYVVAFRDYDKKFSPHLLDWAAFAVMAFPSIVIPALLWWSSKTKYENLVKGKKAKD